MESLMLWFTVAIILVCVLGVAAGWCIGAGLTRFNDFCQRHPLSGKWRDIKKRPPS
jgi:uncharacterized membrane protein